MPKIFRQDVGSPCQRTSTSILMNWSISFLCVCVGGTGLAKWVENESDFFPLVHGFFTSCVCCWILVLTNRWVSLMQLFVGTKWVANESDFFPLVDGFFTSCACCCTLVLTICWVSPTQIFVGHQLGGFVDHHGAFMFPIMCPVCLVSTVAWSVHEVQEHQPFIHFGCSVPLKQFAQVGEPVVAHGDLEPGGRWEFLFDPPDWFLIVSLQWMEKLTLKWMALFLFLSFCVPLLGLNAWCLRLHLRCFPALCPGLESQCCAADWLIILLKWNHVHLLSFSLISIFGETDQKTLSWCTKVFQNPH